MPEVKGSRTWREHRFKKYFEDYQAALFTYGIFALGDYGPAEDFECAYSYGEKVEPEDVPPFQDADCFLRCKVNGELSYKPIQLKELPPQELANRSTHQASLQGLIDGLDNRSYTAQAGREILVVAIYVNRLTTINLSELKMPSSLCIQQLWFFGQLDAQTGFVAGGNPRNSDSGGFATHHQFTMPVWNPASGLTATGTDPYA